MHFFYVNTQEQVLFFFFLPPIANLLICTDKTCFTAGIFPKVDHFTLRSSGALTRSPAKMNGEKKSEESGPQQKSYGFVVGGFSLRK